MRDAHSTNLANQLPCQYLLRTGFVMGYTNSRMARAFFEVYATLHRRRFTAIFPLDTRMQGTEREL